MMNAIELAFIVIGIGLCLLSVAIIISDKVITPILKKWGKS